MTGEQLFSVLLTLIVGPVVLYSVKYWWERRRWKTFTTSISEFAENEAIDDRLTMNDLQALVATKLSDAGYEPDKAKDLMVFGVWFAAGRISHQRRGRYLGNLTEQPPTEEADDSAHDL